MEICNSDWGESFAQIFLIKLAFLRQKKSVNHLTGCPRGSRARLPPWGAPPASCPPRAPSRVDSSSHILQIFQKYSPSVFIPSGFCFMGFLRNIKHATNRNWHWALDQYVSPKNSIKSCQKVHESCIILAWNNQKL